MLCQLKLSLQWSRGLDAREKLLRDISNVFGNIECQNVKKITVFELRKINLRPQSGR